MLRSEVPKMCHKPTVCRHVDHPEAKSWAVRTQGIIYFGKGWACVEDVCLFVCVFVCYCVWGEQLMHLTLPHLIAHQASRQPGSHSHKNTLHPFPHKPFHLFTVSKQVKTTFHFPRKVQFITSSSWLHVCRHADYLYREQNSFLHYNDHRHNAEVRGAQRAFEDTLDIV